MTAQRPFYRSLYFQVLVAIALGILVGWLFPAFLIFVLVVLGLVARRRASRSSRSSAT